MTKDIMTWLMNGPAWLRHAVSLEYEDANAYLEQALQDEMIISIINRLKDEEVGIPALKSGKVYYTKSGNAYWDLFFLADIGFSIEQLGLEEEVEGLLAMQNSYGTYLTQDNIKPQYFCIPTILLASLVKMGYKDDPRIRKYIDIIMSTRRLDGGWHCAKSRAIGQKLEHTESCPMDNLNILMLLGQYDKHKEDNSLEGAIDLLLSHWERREDKWRPYGFGIGKDFKKLKYPAVKYGILRVLDVLSMYPYAIKTKSYQDMLQTVKQKAVDGKYTPESVAKAYHTFDFGQKKEPSRWLTYLINRIEKRTNYYSK